MAHRTVEHDFHTLLSLKTFQWKVFSCLVSEFKGSMNPRCITPNSPSRSDEALSGLTKCDNAGLLFVPTYWNFQRVRFELGSTNIEWHPQPTHPNNSLHSAVSTLLQPLLAVQCQVLWTREFVETRHRRGPCPWTEECAKFHIMWNSLFSRATSHNQENEWYIRNEKMFIRKHFSIEKLQLWSIALPTRSFCRKAEIQLKCRRVLE